MVTQIINADQTQTRVVSIPATSAQALQVLSSLSVGKILPIVVHENFQNGQGLIFFQGQLLQALLPEGTPPGKELLTQVSQLKDKIVLRLLEGQTSRPQTAPATTPQVDVVAAKIDAALRLVETTPLQTPARIPDVAEDAPIAKEALAKLGAALLPADQSVTVREVAVFLKQVSEGQLSKTFREAAAAIKSLLPESKPSDLNTASGRVREELISFLKLNFPEARPTEDYTQKLDKLFATLEREFRSDKRVTADERETLRAVLRSLQQAKNNPEETRAALQTAISKFSAQELPTGRKDSLLDPTQVGRLQELVTRLERSAAAQEFTTQLSPLLQSFGEPALLLFPFIFQNLMNHGEVALHPNEGRKKKQGKNKNRGAENSETFQRIQLSVPLPTLGPIGIDIAVRPKEILGRFTIEEETAAQFLNEQLEYLGAALAQQGFEKMDLTAHVGEVKHSLPDFLTVVRGPTSVFA